MTPEIYEFMQTKLFGLIWAILIVGMVAFTLYHWGYTRGCIDEGAKQKTLFVFVDENRTFTAVDNTGKIYPLGSISNKAPRTVFARTSPPPSMTAPTSQAQETGSCPHGHIDWDHCPVCCH